jgi:hypothetical protein
MDVHHVIGETRSTHEVEMSEAGNGAAPAVKVLTIFYLIKTRFYPVKTMFYPLGWVKLVLPTLKMRLSISCRQKTMYLYDI